MKKFFTCFFLCALSLASMDSDNDLSKPIKNSCFNQMRAGISSIVKKTVIPFAIAARLPGAMSHCYQYLSEQGGSLIRVFIDTQGDCDQTIISNVTAELVKHCNATIESTGIADAIKETYAHLDIHNSHVYLEYIISNETIGSTISEIFKNCTIAVGNGMVQLENQAHLLTHYLQHAHGNVVEIIEIIRESGEPLLHEILDSIASTCNGTVLTQPYDMANKTIVFAVENLCGVYDSAIYALQVNGTDLALQTTDSFVRCAINLANGTFYQVSQENCYDYGYNNWDYYDDNYASTFSDSTTLHPIDVAAIIASAVIGLGAGGWFLWVLFQPNTASDQNSGDEASNEQNEVNSEISMVSLDSFSPQDDDV